MREPLRDKDRLAHMLAAADRVIRYTAGKAYESLVSDDMMYYAVVKNVEIIGEAANMITNDYRDSHSEVEWRSIISMRHVLVHGYYQISKAEVWDTAKINLPPLKSQIEQYISEMK